MFVFNKLTNYTVYQDDDKVFKTNGIDAYRYMNNLTYGFSSIVSPYDVYWDVYHKSKNYRIRIMYYSEQYILEIWINDNRHFNLDPSVVHHDVYYVDMYVLNRNNTKSNLYKTMRYDGKNLKVKERKGVDNILRKIHGYFVNKYV